MASAKILMPFDQTELDGISGRYWLKAEKAVVVDRLLVRSGRNARVEMDVATFFPTREKAPDNVLGCRIFRTNS